MSTKNKNDQEVAYGLFIKFYDSSPSYVNGVEAGMVYEKMCNKEIIERTVHTANIEQFELMAKKMHYTMTHSKIKADPYVEGFDVYRDIVLKPVAIQRVK